MGKSETNSSLSYYIEKGKRILRHPMENLNVIGPVATFAAQITALAVIGDSAYHPGSYMLINEASAFTGMVKNWNYANRLKRSGYTSAARAARWASVGYGINMLGSVIPLYGSIRHYDGGNPRAAYWGFTIPVVLFGMKISNWGEKTARELELAVKFDEGKATRVEMLRYESVLLERCAETLRNSDFKENRKLVVEREQLRGIQKAIENSTK